MMDAETQEVTYVNRAYVTITGHSVESLRQNPSSYREVIHPKDRIRVLSKLADVADSGLSMRSFVSFAPMVKFAGAGQKAFRCPQMGKRAG